MLDRRQSTHAAVNRAVLLTPEGRGAVATVLVDGPGASEIVAGLLCDKSGAPVSLEARPLGRICLGRWGAAGEEVVVCRRADSQVEIHCHGGAAAAGRLLADLTQAGCTAIPWRDWVGLHEPNAIRAAARRALADARTERAAAILLDQYNGALEQGMQSILAELDANRSDVAAARIEEILRWAPLGLHLSEPWRVVLAGPPNVGKSSLINRLVGFQRAIVHDQPGTTRDAVTAAAALAGWPVELTDTAGLRTGDDPLEMAGIARAREEMARGDATVLVFDVAQPWTAAAAVLLAERPGAIVVHNKSDLMPSRPASPTEIQLLSDRPAGILTSALTGEGIELLAREIVGRLVPAEPPPGAAIPFAANQIEQLAAALAAVRDGQIQEARRLLYCLHGEPPGLSRRF